MADLTVTQLSTITSAASTDELAIWQASSGQQKKITVANLVGTALTGTGTNGRIAEWGGASTLQASSLAKIGAGLLTLDAPVSRTLTAWASGSVALTDANNQFTAAQTLTAASGSTSLSSASIVINNQTAGAGNRGGYVTIGKNSDDNAPGHLVCISGSAGANNAYLWPDDSGVWRTLQGNSTAWPTAANRNSGGTVVGAQTSHAAYKEVLGEACGPVEALGHVVEAARSAIKRFVYANGAFGGQEFEGVVIDEGNPASARYGLDPDEEHAFGKSLNVIQAIGDLMRAVAYLAERVEALERG